ncbi:alpha/beta fold hydrolase [Bacillus sp. DX1.1]|uniref:thioesterase II family protein n=1 Tax=unclassified Bacillus (in: firmicutes) TaxID=185979 RepID=UPI002570028F|nr:MULTISPECIES: alpha/beta fold hydrolase [unclassified Bacillus (in: firmicutes)]MDM5154432.1 alpha/beta fold hydrolase [Bacillus sp. DX1.1]WJE83336.1 alpha/beta fold hydrolase [Bacillus sp. DX3.1]
MNEILRYFGTDSRKTKIIFLPYAGGYSLAFRSLHPDLENYFQIISIEPPGHGTSRLPLVSDIKELVELYLKAILPEIKNHSFILFGHSMGGLLSYLLAQKLERLGIFPEHIFISAACPPDYKKEIVSDLTDNDFLQYLIKLGGIPSELSKEKDFLELFLPVIRSDFKAIELFEHEDYTLIESPVHIFNGVSDSAPYKFEKNWCKWVKHADFHSFPGGHMFLLDIPKEVAEKIKSLALKRSEV